jgi:hypothetical protein
VIGLKLKKKQDLTDDELARFWGIEMEKTARDFLTDLLKGQEIKTYEQSKLKNKYEKYTSNIRFDGEMSNFGKKQCQCLVEIKCPYYLNYNKPIIDHYSQMQFYMGCFSVQNCLYLQWTPFGFSLHMTEFDPLLWEEVYLESMKMNKKGYPISFQTNSDKISESMKNHLQLWVTAEFGKDLDPLSEQYFNKKAVLHTFDYFLEKKKTDNSNYIEELDNLYYYKSKSI